MGWLARDRGETDVRFGFAEMQLVRPLLVEEKRTALGGSKTERRAREVRAFFLSHFHAGRLAADAWHVTNKDPLCSVNVGQTPLIGSSSLDEPPQKNRIP